MDDTESQSTHLDQRRRLHDLLAPRLASAKDEELCAGLAGEPNQWRASVHGSASGAIEIDGAKVFVKKIALTDLERFGPDKGSTRNVFELPLFYQYGVGSAGFGPWRELEACLQAGAWALTGECPFFPLVYHWRILPRTAPRLSPDQSAWLDAAVEYWNGSKAVRARLYAISTASASIVLFQEYVPESLQVWLKRRSVEPPDELEGMLIRARGQLQETAAFMNAAGMLHFDLNASNVLTDGKRIYVSDFGLPLCAGFDLSPSEREFFETHRQYDRGYIDWAFVEWLAPKGNPRIVTAALGAAMEECRPVADVLGRFFRSLREESKLTPFPAAELAAAIAVQSSAEPPGPPGRA